MVDFEKRVRKIGKLMHEIKGLIAGDECEIVSVRVPFSGKMDIHIYNPEKLLNIFPDAEEVDDDRCYITITADMDGVNVIALKERGSIQ